MENKITVKINCFDLQEENIKKFLCNQKIIITKKHAYLPDDTIRSNSLKI